MSRNALCTVTPSLYRVETAACSGIASASGTIGVQCTHPPFLQQGHKSNCDANRFQLQRVRTSVMTERPMSFIFNAGVKIDFLGFSLLWSTSWSMKNYDGALESSFAEIEGRSNSAATGTRVSFSKSKSRFCTAK